MKGFLPMFDPSVPYEWQVHYTIVFECAKLRHKRKHKLLWRLTAYYERARTGKGKIRKG